MTLLLLFIIYIAFVGLGIPDSLIGSAWSAIYTELTVSVDAVSGITLLVSGCTVLSSIFSSSSASAEALKQAKIQFGSGAGSVTIKSVKEV